MANKKDKVKVRRSIRIDPTIDELILSIQVKHGFKTYTQALEYLLKEKAIELALSEASLD